MSRGLEPGTVAPVFVVLTLFFAAGVVSRFDGFAGEIPGMVHGAALVASIPLLLIAGALERRVDHGGNKNFPLWMQIDSRPIRWTFTLALTYLGIVVLQVFDVQLGIVDPNPPEVWPAPQRLLWFLGFSFGMSFANYLVACRALIPALRVVTAPFSLLPSVLGLPLLAACGAGLGWLALQSLARGDEVQGYVEEIRGEPIWLVSGLFVMAFVPVLLERLWRRE